VKYSGAVKDGEALDSPETNFEKTKDRQPHKGGVGRIRGMKTPITPTVRDSEKKTRVVEKGLLQVMKKGGDGGIET